MHHADPAAALQAAFAAIAAGPMAGLPVLNPALSVAVVDCQPWEGEWLAALVLPWALNLMLLPGPGGRFRPIRVGESQFWRFPSGEYEFLGNEAAGIGFYQSCALFSPVFEFATQADAEAVARESLRALLQPAADEVAEARARAEAARLQGQPVAQQPVSRRAFLRGGLFGNGQP